MKCPVCHGDVELAIPTVGSTKSQLQQMREFEALFTTEERTEPPPILRKRKTDGAEPGPVP